MDNLTFYKKSKKPDRQSSKVDNPAGLVRLRNQFEVSHILVGSVWKYILGICQICKKYLISCETKL